MKRKEWRRPNIVEKSSVYGRSNSSSTENSKNRNKGRSSRRDLLICGESESSNKKKRGSLRNMLLTWVVSCIRTSLKRQRRWQITNPTVLRVLATWVGTKTDDLCLIFIVADDRIVNESRFGEVVVDLLFTVPSSLEALNCSLAFLSIVGVQMAIWGFAYILWKQSTREMAAYLDISGSMCLPRGVERSRLKF